MNTVTSSADKIGPGGLYSHLPTGRGRHSLLHVNWCTRIYKKVTIYCEELHNVAIVTMINMVTILIYYRCKKMSKLSYHH